MKLAVFAYHDVGYGCLQWLLDQGEEIAAVVTHEDDPDEKIWFRSVAALARSHGIPVYTPRNPNTAESVATIRRLAPDLIFSFYYRRLLVRELLEVPPLGAINLHGSLLPKYRGRAPVNWALVRGETVTGVTLHHMVEEADAGDIIAQKSVPIEIEDTAPTLFRKITRAAVSLLSEVYPLVKTGRAPRFPQDSKLATKFGARRPEDGRISWEQSSWTIYNLIRAVTHPFPGAFTFCGGRKLYLWESALKVTSGLNGAGSSVTIDDAPFTAPPALPGTIQGLESAGGLWIATADGSLLVTRAQLEGDDEVPAGELVLCGRVSLGARLGDGEQSTVDGRQSIG